VSETSPCLESVPAVSSLAGGGDGSSALVDCLSRSILVNSINCSLLLAEKRCRRAMTCAVHRRRRLTRQLTMRCPPLTVYGPASSPSCTGQHSPGTVWNHASTRPFNAVDAVRPSDAARLSDKHLQLIADRTTVHPGHCDVSAIYSPLLARLKLTVNQYIHRELEMFACHLVPVLFDLLHARYSLTHSSALHLYTLIWQMFVTSPP